MSLRKPQPHAIRIPYDPFPLTAQIHASPARFRVLCCGRRFGKSLFAVAEGARMSVEVFNAGLAQPGLAHRPRGVILAPTYEMVLEDWLSAQQLLKAAIVQTHAARMSLDLGLLGDIDFKSAEAQGGAGRGAGYDWAILDEASKIPQRAWEEDLRPALADRHGRVLACSTPWGRNWFYQLWRRGQEGDPSVASWQYPTIAGWRSRLAPWPDRLLAAEQEWEEIRRTTSERTFQQEYGGDFLEDSGQFLSVGKCLRGLLRPAIPGRSYYAGIDVGRVEDWMVAVVGEVESRQVVGVVRCRQRSWDAQKQTIIHLLTQYPHVHAFVDSTGVGSPIAHDLRRAGLSIEDVIFTERSKHDLVDNLTTALDHGYLGVPNQAETQWLLDELRAYREWKTDAGRVKWGAPDGQHDDGVSALMLMAWGLRHDWRPLEETAPVEGGTPGLTVAQLREYSAMKRAWQRAYPTIPAPSSIHSLGFQSRSKWRSKLVLT